MAFKELNPCTKVLNMHVHMHSDIHVPVRVCCLCTDPYNITPAVYRWGELSPAPCGSSTPYRCKCRQYIAPRCQKKQFGARICRNFDTVEPLLKGHPGHFCMQDTSPGPQGVHSRGVPEMRTPLYTGHFTRSPRCPQ